MTAGEFITYCNENKPSVIIYDTSNSEGHKCGNGYAEYLSLVFDSVTAWLNPNYIGFKGDGGVMGINGVTEVTLSGDIITVHAVNGNCKRSYVFIMR